MKMDLNCDLGESFGRYTVGDDANALGYVTSANVACGLHAGDPLVMQVTVRLAVERGVAVGAHPGYPDMQGFGRRVMDLTPEEVEAFVLYQIGALAGFTRSEGVGLSHVKPHGALYNQAAKDAVLAAAIARAVLRFSPELILVGLAGSKLIEAGEEAGLRTAGEGFPDRAYNPDGSLRSRKEPGAMLESAEEVCAQAVRLAGDGRIQTLCIHGDSPHAGERAAAVRAALEGAGVQIAKL
jgi:5-oxoprolinase (ATP-hydrolysing) subunit A